MQNTGYGHYVIGVVTALVAGLNFTFGLHLQTEVVLSIVFAAIGIGVLVADAIKTHGKLTAPQKAEFPPELMTFFSGLMKTLEDLSAKQTGTAPTGNTTTTQPPPATGGSN